MVHMNINKYTSNQSNITGFEEMRMSDFPGVMILLLNLRLYMGRKA